MHYFPVYFLVSNTKRKKKKGKGESLGSFIKVRLKVESIRVIRILCKNTLLAFGKTHLKPKLTGQEEVRELRSLGKSRKYRPARFHHVLLSLCNLVLEVNQIINGYKTTTQLLTWPKILMYRHLVRNILTNGLQTSSKLIHINF